MNKRAYLFVLLYTAMVCGFVKLSSDTETLKKIAKEYKSYAPLYKRPDSSLSWTVALCAAPSRTPHITMDSFFISQAVPSISLHGNKLYKLFVKDIGSYCNERIKEQPIGQVIVKETWNTMQINSDSLSDHPLAKQNLNDQHYYVPTTLSELFIMYKEKENEQNDKGWVYGVVNMEGDSREPEVLTQGKISNCMNCHKGTKYDRIFGVNKQ